MRFVTWSESAEAVKSEVVLEGEGGEGVREEEGGRAGGEELPMVGGRDSWV